MLDPVASWLLAYLGHGLLWLGAAWLVATLRPGLAARHRELLWRTALLASLLGPTIQALAGVAPLAGSVALTAAVPAGASAERMAGGAAGAGLPAAAATPEPPLAAAGVARTGWRGPLRLALLFVALVSAWRLAAGLAAGARLRRLLASRDELLDGGLRRRFDRLCRAAGARGIRLSSCDSLSSPIAFGVIRREICLPSRVLTELAPDQQVALLGHELAHHLRHDPWASLLAGMAERLLWFQPLHRVAFRSWREAVEELCDAWSARHAAGGLAMASCLTEVAGWLRPPADALPVPAMARPGAALGRRVERLVEQPPAPVRAGRPLRAAAGALLALAPFAAPSGSSGPFEPAPGAPPTALAQLLVALDGEFDLARAELDAVGAELRAAAVADPAYDAALRGIEARLARLRELRASLAGRLAAAPTHLPAQPPRTSS